MILLNAKCAKIFLKLLKIFLKVHKDVKLIKDLKRPSFNYKNQDEKTAIS